MMEEERIPLRTEYLIFEFELKKLEKNGVSKVANEIAENIRKRGNAEELANNLVNRTLDRLFQKANQRQMDVETEEGTIIEVIEKGEVLAWIDELRAGGHI